MTSIDSENKNLIRRRLRSGLNISAMTLALAACSNIDPSVVDQEIASAPAYQIPTDIPTFAGLRPSIIADDDIYRLSESQKRSFLSYFDSMTNRSDRPTKRLYNYMEKTVRAFEYSEHTRTAEEVHRLGGGNCLSLANMTTALARLVGIEVGYQLMNDLPVFEMQEKVILRGVHVRTVLYDPPPKMEAGSGIDVLAGLYGRSKLIIDYFPTGRGRFIRNISEDEFTAMYYRNLAADAIAAENYSRGYWYTQTSLEHAPDHADAINMLAIMYRRAGDERTAENVYQYGIALTKGKPTLLRNYRTLLDSQGRLDEAQTITARLARLDDTTPFDWWFMAEDAYEQENYSDALSYYEKAVEMAPYLHEGYFGMAKSYYQLGRIDSARSAMSQAVDNAGRLKFRTIYEAKLAALTGKR